METDVPEPKSSTPTFSELIDAAEGLPDARHTQKLIGVLEDALYPGAPEEGFAGARATSVPMKEHMWEEAKQQPSTTYVRLRCELTGRSFWLPEGAPVPVIAFERDDESGRVGDWAEIIHPRLAVADREQLMHALVDWAYEKAMGAAAELEFALRRLQCLREQETLQPGGPDDPDASEDSQQPLEGFRTSPEALAKMAEEAVTEEGGTTPPLGGTPGTTV